MTSAFSIAIAFIFLLSLLLVAILLIAHRGPRHPSRLLAAYVGIFCLVLLQILLLSSGWILRFPHLFRVSSPFIYLIGPTAYLYVRSVLRREDGFQAKDAWHLLPFALHVLEMLPFFFQPGTVKEAYLQDLVAQNEHLPQMVEGILPPYFHLILRAGLVFLYALAQLRLPDMLKKDHSRERTEIQLQAGSRQWLALFSYFLLGISGLILLIGLFPALPGSYIFYLVNGLIALEISAVVILLFFWPNILYGLPATVGDASAKSYDAAGSILNKAEIEAYRARIEDHFQTQRPYLNSGYSLPDLAKETGIPRHRLSAAINEGFGVNFNELINRLRIEFLLSEVDPEVWETLSIEGLGNTCGFHSRSTFSRAFRKVVGMSPSAYREQFEA